MQTGSGRAPLIIAIVAALITYVALGHQTPFGFLHHLGHHKITISTDKTPDAAEDARQAAEDAAQNAADREQALRDHAQELSEQAKELAQAEKERAAELSKNAADLAKVESAKAVAALVPPAPPAPPAPAAVGSETEVRVLDPFDSVTIENSADVTVTIGDKQSVTITGGAGNTDTRVRDGKLTVSGSIPGVRVAIIVPHLHELQVNGYGKVSLVGLRDPIMIKANGAVELWGSGTVDSADLVMNGPSKFQLAKLEAKNLTVQVNGVGDADVFATENLTADVKGVGHVRYRGDPHLVTKIDGPGTVQHLSASQG